MIQLDNDNKYKMEADFDSVYTTRGHRKKISYLTQFFSKSKFLFPV